MLFDRDQLSFTHDDPAIANLRDRVGVLGQVGITSAAKHVLNRSIVNIG